MATRSSLRLHRELLAALDMAIEQSEWEVSESILKGIELLCRGDCSDPRVVEAYLRIANSRQPL